MKRITKQDKHKESVDYLIVTVSLFTSMLLIGVLVSSIAYLFTT